MIIQTESRTFDTAAKYQDQNTIVHHEKPSLTTIKCKKEPRQGERYCGDKKFALPTLDRLDSFFDLVDDVIFGVAQRLRGGVLQLPSSPRWYGRL